MNIRKIIVSVLLPLMCVNANAHDFMVVVGEQNVCFNIKDAKKQTVEVTYRGKISAKQSANYEGELTIPAKVRVGNTVYSVVGIGPKAFCGAEKLTGIVMPSGVTTIGDFAFEGCKSLSKIIFPGNNVKFGQGVFFKCDKIENVSFGSDWKTVDLKMFRWSDSLTTITIPAKMEQIRNMKSLKSLKSVSVDVNNTRFSTVDGVLYNHTREILYGCPRAYEGRLVVAAETKKVMGGALIDCQNVTSVDFPANLEQMSFRDFSRMNRLSEVTFRGETPASTAMKGDNEVFLLQVANPNVEIIVSKSAEKTYKKALVQDAGEYAEIGGKVPYTLKEDDMPLVKNIKGVKKFSE